MRQTRRSLLIGFLACFSAGEIQAADLTWEAFKGPNPAGIGGAAVVSEPISLDNPMLGAIEEKLYKLPWAPGEALLLEAEPDEAALAAFGFWAGPEAYSILVRRGEGWLHATRDRERVATSPRLAYFGHQLSGQDVDWPGPARIVLFGKDAEKAVRVRRVELWKAGCVAMTMQRCERELLRARQFLGWTKRIHGGEQEAVAKAADAVRTTNAQIRRDSEGLLDEYMALPGARYALEVMANHCRHFHHEKGRFAAIGYADAWTTLFYGRPEFEACWDARAAAQQALWTERPETLPGEAREALDPQAEFAISVTHGLTKFRRDQPFPEPLKTHYRLCLARGEVESCQVVLASWGKPIRNATVSAQWEGTGPHPEISFRPVGYVHTKPDPTNIIEYVGWWPDPLMPPGPVDVAAGETQPVWGSVHAGTDTPAGDHRARLTVSADGVPPLHCDLTVHVFDFDLGFTHLPSLLSLRLEAIKQFYKLDSVTEAIRRRWYAFCLEYRMNPNNIYARTAIPAEEDLKFCVDRGLNAVVMHVDPLREATRNSRDNLEVWISNDNKAFEKVVGDWTLSHNEGQIVIRGLDVTARYVKCHSTLSDTKYEFTFATLEPGRMIARDGDDEYTGPAAYVGSEDGTKPLLSFGAKWGAALDYKQSSLGVDLGQPRHLTALVLVGRGSTAGVLERVRRFYDAAAAHGLGDRAYLYGFDEWRDVNRYGDIKRTYDMLKAAAPGVKACSTVVHPVDPIADTVDAWCPCLCYNYAGYEDARKRGQEVWYYAGGTPYDPFPTHELLNVPAVEARAFFWVAWRFQYTGWLHWELNLWQNNMAGDKRWPDVPWDPARGGVRNGEVGRIYPGPDATPLPSVRLENMRDGIEDYDYFWMLNDICGKLPDADPRKEAALQLMQDAIRTLCPSRAQFERDPGRILDLHEQLGRAIERLR